MAEETKKPEVVVAAAAAAATPEVEKPVVAAAAVPEKEEVVVEAEKTVEVEVEAAAEKPAESAEAEVVEAGAETNVVGELPESQRKALEELKKLIQEACAKREFSAPPPPPPTPAVVKEEEKKEEEVVEEKKEEETTTDAAAAATTTTEGEKPAEEAAAVVEPAVVTPEVAAPAAAVATPEVATPAVAAPAPTPEVAAPAAAVATPEVVAPVPTPEVAAPAAAEVTPAPVVEAPKTEEPAKTEEVVKTEEEAPKTEEVVKETIKETILERFVSAVSVFSSSKSSVDKSAAEKSVAEKPAEETATKEAEAETETSAAAATTEAEVIPEEPVEPEEVSIYGIPLLADERTDVILLKFLRARDFKVKEAFTMIRNTVRWRKEFGVEELLEEDLGSEYEKVLFKHGCDKEGRIVCYNVVGEYQDKASDADKRKKLLKWLIQFVEKIIRDLDFSPKGINTIVLVNDLKNPPGYGGNGKKMMDKFLNIFQDNYPEFVAKQVCVNTSWWSVATYWVYLTVVTPRSKSKFVFASASKTPEVVFRFIAPEHVPVQYGGHSKTGESEFTPADSITEVTVKPGSKHAIELEYSEGTELAWELRVIGWDVNYGAEFVPAKEGGYTLNISKPKKVASTEEPVLSDSFKVGEAGKVVITIDNHSSKKKKLLYRSKVKASV